jgi:hypothetical protein
MTGVELIAAERQRQIEKEGWTQNHDDEAHSPGDLALAGACYACNAATMMRIATKKQMADYEKYSSHGYRWPFLDKYWKPKDPLRDLVRAGALIAAEIDRLQRNERAAEKAGGGGE